MAFPRVYGEKATEEAPHDPSTQGRWQMEKCRARTSGSLRSPPLAPPAPQRIARLWIAPQQSAPLCSSVSQLLWRSLAPHKKRVELDMNYQLAAAGHPEGQPGADGMSANGIVSRVTPVHTAVRNCTRDEGRPFEVGNQVLISSHRKLLSSKAMVVNVAEKSERDFGRYD